MKTLNFEKLNELQPTVYNSLFNQMGQKVVLVEHPTKGDEYPVIAMFPNEKVAVCTDFFDVDDMISLGDYTPNLIKGEVKCYFEI